MLGIAAVAMVGTLGVATSAVWGDTAAAVDANEAKVPNNYDLARVTHGHASAGRLVHTVSVYGRYVPSLANSAAFPSLTIDPGSLGGPVYQVQHYSDGTSDVSRGSTVTGTAAYTRVDPDTIRIVFRKAAIGNPSRYGWRVNYYAANPDDFSPNKGFWLHRL